MNKNLEPVVKTIQDKFGAGCEEFRDEVHLFVKPEQIVDALTLLRDEQGFELLSAYTAVDYYPSETPRFHLIYQLTSLVKNLSVQVRVAVNGSSPKVPTVTGVYASANWREREIFDMFGIEFEGHPDPRRILMPEDHVGHPLRKDFPLGYEEPQFTFNFDEIDLRKPYVKE
ncbi:MAG TPA: NADH-quinone oxidoreductase subunit C [Anaerolineales bacterium]|nr:NADH-quinone oxidoreductase subunit C [Anaerolineales bacterium]HMZ43709.1 NADH-quinone oxidoreductase subunit C [Anaerolineales bacterium]HNA54655.1 NADH-quinone oxidoreductase subunit C [Anaerolineales bacterium]HNB87114.1 NADH-quinone oxidoreductase subunit C [Anaerolineales bacterium]HNJ14289.1 NADH-quinone oxidoreductase subunit C [Anaerolineales bacterium]